MDAAGYADVETSSEAYAKRFSGPGGSWLLQRQTRLLKELLHDIPPSTILDIGGGHAQSVEPILAMGHKLTVLGSSSVCAYRLSAWLDAGKISFQVGDLLDLPFPDHSFDVVVSLRLIPHCDAWPRLIRAMCRVARAAVVFDYPCQESLNGISPVFFEKKRKLEGNTRTWISFRQKEIKKTLVDAGWSTIVQRKQFFWPMVLHRKLNSPRISSVMEGLTATIGLRSWLGSPVLIKANPAGLTDQKA